MIRIPKKKFRHQKKYYSNLKNSPNYDWLDFSGGENSWFDLWHDHLDWEGWGNLNWKHRKAHLDALVNAYEALKNKLSTYKKEYQSFIFIEVNDSSYDAVYINTDNPNGHDNFPMKLKSVVNEEIPHKKIKEYIAALPYEKIIAYDPETGFSVYLYDQKNGLPII
jgi:hypothetical protein